MPKDAGQITVGGNGSVRVAPLGTTPPADAESAFEAGWIDLGYLSEDGATFTDGKDVTDIMVWQEFYAARSIVTSREFTIAFALRQFSGHGVELAFGGTVESDGGSGFKFVPPSPDQIDYRAFALEWLDGDHTFRLIVPKVMVSENVEVAVKRSDPSDLPITLKALATGSGDVWNIYSTDPTWAEAS